MIWIRYGVSRRSDKEVVSRASGGGRYRYFRGKADRPESASGRLCLSLGFFSGVLALNCRTQESNLSVIIHFQRDLLSVGGDIGDRPDNSSNSHHAVILFEGAEKALPLFRFLALWAEEEKVEQNSDGNQREKLQ